MNRETYKNFVVPMPAIDTPGRPPANNPLAPECS
jgi:hypothetical protein